MCDGFSYSPTLSRLRDLGLRLKVKKQAPPSPDYIPGPKHTDDEIVAEDKPDAEDASPTAQLPDYVLESDPEADLEEDDDEDPDKTSRFETDESAATPPPHPAYRVTARISIPALVPTPVWSDEEVARLLTISTPPSSPLSPWSSPLPQIPSPSLSLSPPSLVLSPAPPPSPIRSLGYRAAMIQMRAEAASTSHSLPLPPPFILSPTRPDVPSLGIPPLLPISVPTSSPPLLLPSARRREDRPEVTLPPRKRLGISLGPRYEIRHDLEREVGYGITDSWDEIVETLQGAPVSTDTELGRHMTAFEIRVRQDTDEIYTRLDDEKSQRQLLAGRLNMLFRDRRAQHIHVIKWRQMLDCPDRLGGDRWMRQAVISEMLKADQRRSAEMRELRTSDHTRQQQLIQTSTGQQGPAGGPAQPELPEEAGSSS
ncbi:hypothetical protein Tco_0595877 [Tanacetum coccineum]